MRRCRCSLCGRCPPNPTCPRCEHRGPADAGELPTSPVGVEPEHAAEQREVARRAALLEIVAAGRRVHVALVGCGSGKQRGRHRARRLYTGGLFRAALGHAVETADVVFIVSAKHGLLEPEELVEYYNVQLPSARDERRWWGRTVERALRLGHLGLPLRVVIYAGSTYADPIVDASRGNDWLIEQPLRGLGVGRRLQWFARRRCEIARDRQTVLPLPGP